MSRAFLKDDAVEDAVMVPPRAPLPADTPNYVTPRGLQLLRDELAGLEAERARLDTLPADSNDRKRKLAFVNGRIVGVQSRIGSARVVEPASQPQDEVRFGAAVTLRSKKGGERRLQIVGVDESDPSKGRIPFTAPIARQMTGKKAGQTVAMPSTRGEEKWEIVAIAYE